MAFQYINYSSEAFKLFENNFFDLYHSAFPSCERQKDTEIVLRLNDGRYDAIFVVNDENQLLGFALLFNLNYNNWYFLDYIAIHERFRSQGLGSLLLKEINYFLTAKNFKLILEAEDPAFGIDKAIMFKRIEFYKRNGFKSVLNFLYSMPPLNGELPTKMILLCLNHMQTHFQKSEIFSLIEIIFSKIYRQDKDCKLLKEMILLNKSDRYSIA